jgi:MarR family transcriptional regulator, transcriptional regulator for hemolysin
VSAPPAVPPLGVRLVRTARAVTQAFDRALVEAGGSASTWQILLLVHTERWRTQARIAEAMGVTSATLTHHLNALETRGLVRRWREAANRRVQHVALTEAGEALFGRLREVAMVHEERLRSQLTDADAALLGDLLEKVRAGLGQTRARTR